MSTGKNGMNTKILIPTPLRQYAGKQDAVDVHACTVADALAKLTARHPDLKRHLYTEEGRLRAFVNVYLNDEDVRYLSEKEQTPVKDGDQVSIIPSIAGGRDETGYRLSAISFRPATIFVVNSAQALWPNAERRLPKASSTKLGS